MPTVNTIPSPAAKHVTALRANTQNPASAAHAQGVNSHTGQNTRALKLNLTDLGVPAKQDLHVEGLKASWLDRLFGIFSR